MSLTQTQTQTRVKARRLPQRLAQTVRELSPGLGLCAVATLLSLTVHHYLDAVSPLLVAILAGAFVGNLVHIPQRWAVGLDFCAKRLLRTGVALLGLQLLFTDILDLGWDVITMVLAVVTLGITGSMVFGRLLGLSWTQRLLIACGFSICGAAAVAAVDGVVDAEEEETLTAVALVVIFGTLMIPAVPMLASLSTLSSTEAGLLAGGSIHEVAQVVAVGGAVGGGTLAVAVVVKLARVLMLAPVLAIVSLYRRRRMSAAAVKTGHPPLVPLFVLTFVAMVAVRSTGVVPESVLRTAGFVETALLAAAMFALGAGARVATLRSVGMRPFLLAACSTLLVTGIALTGAALVR